MFVYQKKIDDKDALILVSEAQCDGKQVPVHNDTVLAVTEEDGVLKAEQVFLDENGDVVNVSITLEETSISANLYDTIDLKGVISPCEGIPDPSVVTWGTSDSAIVSCSGPVGTWEDCTVAGSFDCIGEGTCTVSATYTYQGMSKTATCTITVTE